MKVIVQTVVTPFVSSFLYLLVFGVSLGAQVQMRGGVPYLAFLIPGLMMMGLMNNAFQNSSSSIVSSKFSGDLEDIRVAPITNQQIVWAMSLGGVVRGGLVAMITYFVGAVFYYVQYKEFLRIAHPLVLLYFVIMGGLIFGMIGIAVAFWANNFDQLSAFSAFVLLPLTYLGGVFISVESLHPFWQSVAKMNPLLYLINGLRYGVLGVSDVELSHSVILSLLGFVVFYALSLWSLRKGSFQRW
jgi:ABC-2 type transport system permease protein